MLDNREAAIRARNIITERSPALVNTTVPSIVAKIPTALELWTRVNLAYPDRRKLFEEEVTTAPAVAGIIDLSNYANGTTNNIDISDIAKTVIYDSSGNPMTKVERYNHLIAAMYDTVYRSCFLDGFKLRVRNTDGLLTSYALPVRFTAPEYPVTVGGIHKRLENDFINFLAQYAVGGIKPEALEMEIKQMTKETS